MTDIRQGPGRFGADLTPRERFSRTMHYQHVDYISHLEFGYWDELKQDWLAQGHLPASFRQPDGSILPGLVTGQFALPIFEYLFGEGSTFGQPIPPFNFSSFGFLTVGDGTYGAGGPQIGPLDPHPGG